MILCQLFLPCLALFLTVLLPVSAITPLFASRIAIQQGPARQHHDTQIVFQEKELGQGITGPHFFAQPRDHAKPGQDVWQQRYYLSLRHWTSSNRSVPVILLDGGETSIQDRLSFLDTGIVDTLASAVGGIGIILEHRYYGDANAGSFPVENFTTENMKYLDLDQTLEDSANFMRHVKLPGVSQDISALHNPYIYYGGSYAGAKAAIMAVRYPTLVWGAFGSSAVTLAAIDYWRYFEAIRRGGPPECISAIQDVVELVDGVLLLPETTLTRRLKKGLKALFGLEDLLRDEDFTSVLTIPLGDFQAENWLDAPSSSHFRQLCQALRGSQTFLYPKLGHLLAYADFIKKTYVQTCSARASIEACFGTSDAESFQSVDIPSSRWRAWAWQVCTQWGYFMPAPPSTHPHRSLISRLQTLDYAREVCKKAFDITLLPDVQAVNQYGGLALNRSRLSFIDGQYDPWREVTPHAHSAEPRPDTLEEPFHLIPRATHHWDEFGIADRTQEPRAIQLVHEKMSRAAKRWIKEYDIYKAQGATT